tara:strand:- start:1934 stop:2854 length:921 start_codon:yes stop_codon:yes gene_type:complete
MTSFDALKKNSASELDKLTEALTKLDSNNSQTRQNGPDDRIWKPEVDKAGNGYAVIRFLPAPENEDVPFVRVWDHGFQGPQGQWYIEKSLTTIGQKDPVSEYNSMLWNSGIESNKDLVRKQKRRLSFYSNILVVKDPNHPENEGKVFLYKYGKKIFEKLNDLMNPSFEDEKPVNPFDLWQGANFKLKIRNVEGYRNYDKSEFDSPAPLLDDDEKLEAVWKSEYALGEHINPDNYKSYDELKTKLYRVLALGEAAGSGDTSFAVAPKEASAPSMATATAENTSVPLGTSAADTDDESLSFFQNLAKS